MKRRVDIAIPDIVPSLDAVMKLQGVPSEAEIQPRVLNSAKTALQLFTDLARPLGVIADISRGDFEAIYNGIGLNDSPGPIEKIYPKASQMALFAATVGPGVVKKISDLFGEGDFAFGNHFDAAASNGTDLISHVLQAQFKIDLIRQGRATKDTVILAYSPGYCGWHISSQKLLFDYLQPEDIGITLRDSFLMEPLKSISGVLIAGPRNIHVFEAAYPFCSHCKSQVCGDRRLRKSE